ncbi:hypothetical protein SDC9_72531 [bioreactor metagenome]|uniref:Flagellar protein FlaG n=1 Tax=bioreactor metagenome TaxID=1076179 RepID=A0A644YBZ8_9ZZZZ
MENLGINQVRVNTVDFSMNNTNTFKEDIKKFTVNENTTEREITQKEVEKSVEKLNKFLEDEKVHVEYEVHDKFNQLMIKIIDDDTKEVLQELPPRKIIDMVAKMCEMVGILMDKKA